VNRTSLQILSPFLKTISLFSPSFRLSQVQLDFPMRPVESCQERTITQVFSFYSSITSSQAVNLDLWCSRCSLPSLWVSSIFRLSWIFFKTPWHECFFPFLDPDRAVPPSGLPPRAIFLFFDRARSLYATKDHMYVARRTSTYRLKR